MYNNARLQYSVIEFVIKLDIGHIVSTKILRKIKHVCLDPIRNFFYREVDIIQCNIGTYTRVENNILIFCTYVVGILDIMASILYITLDHQVYQIYFKQGRKCIQLQLKLAKSSDQPL